MSYGQGAYGQGGYGISMTKTATINLVLEEEGQMTVNVSDLGGDPIANVTVDVSGAASLSGTTDENGAVVFDGIEPATYTVTASKTGFFKPGDSDVPEVSAEVSEGDFT